MRFIDIISKTKQKIKLSESEIQWFIKEYTDGNIPDYQMSAWLMAVCLNSLTKEETVYLTTAMRDSGKIMDLSSINGITVDKHSTGGVGDKTTLIIAPIVAACGGYCPKMSGRGLGLTGGTIDKLESISGFQTNIPFDKFISIVNKHGFSVIAQSEGMALADKKLYALRDATNTVDSIPLICSSIMSKKLAMNADCILLDVKCGNGAFMKTQNNAEKLAKLMIKVAKKSGKKCRAMVTDMDMPLGMAVGNSLEVIEAMEVLKGNRKDRLYDICIELSANMLTLSGHGTLEECRKSAEKVITNGSAFEKFEKTVSAQGGDTACLEDYSKFAQASYKKEIYAKESDYISNIESGKIGLSASLLGAGRQIKESSIDFSAGIVLSKTVGDYAEKGELIMTLYSSAVSDFSEAEAMAESGVAYSDEKIQNQIIKEIIG